MRTHTEALERAGRRAYRRLRALVVQRPLAAAQHDADARQVAVHDGRQRHEHRRLPLVRLVLGAARVPLVGARLEPRDAAEKQNGEGQKAGAHQRHPHPRLVERARSRHENAPLQHDLAEEVGVPRPFPQAGVAPVVAVGGVVAVAELRLVGPHLAREADDEHDEAEHVVPRERRIARRVPRAAAQREQCGQKRHPHDEELQQPKDEERELALAYAVEALVGAHLQNAHEEVRGEPHAPHDDGGRDHDGAKRVRIGQAQREHGEQHEVDAVRQVGHFVELARARHEPERHLEREREQRRQRQLPLVEHERPRGRPRRRRR
mmetsp:Transcript_24078/g.58734  ORF Transcript_24078/g.58734 Transcript_24078/m.58734 type:complete len:320 (-) Transcript_24078:23-982(-)